MSLQIVIESVHAVRLDGQIVKFKAGATIETGQHANTIITQVDPVLVPHTAGLAQEVAEYLVLRPNATTVATPLATYLAKL